ncbi:AAA family ATPase [Deferribacter thermophilus]|uniref:ExeA family protein n=1 Tax=Deferribacter thermophilus TaxID=53573 RepID=UPI003C179673
MSVKQFYNLKELPFNNTPDLKYFYKSSNHVKAMLKLHYLIEERKGLGVVLGPIGNGKTTIARLFYEEIDPDIYESVFIVVVHSEISSEWFLKKLSVQLGIEDIPSEKPEMVTKLFKKIQELNDNGRKVVVLIDEAQMLTKKEVMEEIRGLLNFEDENGKMINFVLFGLPELEENLKLDEPLFQRIAVRVILQPLTLEDTKNYIAHRLKIAGGDENLFEDDSIPIIYENSKGIPRLINTICDNALFEGYLRKSQKIGVDIVKQVCFDLGLA